MLQRIGCGKCGQCGAVLATVFFQFTQRMPHRNLVGIGTVTPLQLRAQGAGIGLGQCHGFDIGQPAPGIATGWMQGQCGAIVLCRLVKAAGMHQCIAQQNSRRQGLWGQGNALAEGGNRGVCIAQLLMIAAQVEPRHCVLGIEGGGVLPTGQGGVDIAQCCLRATQVAMQLGIVGADMECLLQAGLGQRRAARLQLHDGQIAQRLGMVCRLLAGLQQQGFGTAWVAITQGACTGMHRGDDGLWQACHARVDIHGAACCLARRAR